MTIDFNSDLGEGYLGIAGLMWDGGVVFVVVVWGRLGGWEARMASAFPHCRAAESSA